MSRKTLSKAGGEASGQSASRRGNLVLALTLVPVILGILLLGVRALGYLVLRDAQSQLIVGVLFFLLSFAIFNALQKRWRLAAGWGLLMATDLVLLAWVNLWAEAVAIVIGLVGLGFIIVEFFRQYQQGKAGILGK